MCKEVRNIWELVSDDPEEIETLRKKSDAMISILLQAKKKAIGKAKLKQVASLSFRECNALYRGEVDKLSLERVFDIAEKSGFDPRYIDTLRGVT